MTSLEPSLTAYVRASDRVVTLCLRHGLIEKEVKERLYPLDVAPYWLTIVVPALGVEAPIIMPCLRLIAEQNNHELLQAIVGCVRTGARPIAVADFIKDLVQQKVHPDNRRKNRALDRAVEGALKRRGRT